MARLVTSAAPRRSRGVRPVYGHLTWLAVVNPAERTSTKVLKLLDSAHRAARRRFQRRTGRGRQLLTPGRRSPTPVTATRALNTHDPAAPRHHDVEEHELAAGATAAAHLERLAPLVEPVGSGDRVGRARGSGEAGVPTAPRGRRRTRLIRAPLSRVAGAVAAPLAGPLASGPHGRRKTRPSRILTRVPQTAQGNKPPDETATNGQRLHDVHRGL